MQRPDDGEFTLIVESMTAVAPCLSFTLYADGVDRPGVVDFYERARALLGAALTHYQTDSMKRAERLTVRAETMVPTWMANPAEDKTYYVSFTGAGTASGITAANLNLEIVRPARTSSTPLMLDRRRAHFRQWYKAPGDNPSRPITSLRVTLPVDHRFAATPEEFVTWALDLAVVRRASFIAGSGGYALVHDAYVSSPRVRAPMVARIASLCRRYPGLEWELPSRVTRHLVAWDPVVADIVYYFPRVSWLTALGEEIVTRLGGVASLQRAVASTSEIRVHRVGDGRGAVVQAGDAPDLGNLGKGELLPLQRQVAKVLRRGRLPSTDPTGRHGEDWERDWLEMFDKEHD